MRIGHSRIPRMHVPALLKSQMILFDLASLQRQWSIVCYLPPFDFGEAVFLNQYQRTVQKEGATLLGMLPFADPFPDPHLPKTKVLCIPLLADPLQRLRRVFGLTNQPATNRCQSFIIDPQRVIRYHLIHQLNWRGLAFLMEILKHCQTQDSPSIRPPVGLRVMRSTSVSPPAQKTKALSTLIKIS